MKSAHPDISTNTELEPYQSIDFNKLLSIFKNSVLGIGFIFFTTLSIAYFTIRWTKPLFKSESELKLDFKSEASALGISSMVENQNLNHISGEIELLSSKLFYKKVIDAANITVSYNSRGNFLNDERYKHTPFTVRHGLVDGQLLDKEIDIDFVSNDEFNIKYTLGGKEFSDTHKFGDKLSIAGSTIIIDKTQYFKDSKSKEDYFFVIKSLDALYQYFERNLEIHPLNFQANTIKISLKDHNQYKARELVDIIDSIYLVYSQEQKTIENNNKINWLNGELRAIEKRLETYEDYFEKFTINNRTNNLDKVLVETIEAIQELDSQKYELQQGLDGVNELQEYLATPENRNLIIITNSSVIPSAVLKEISDYNELVLDFERISQTHSKETYAFQKKHKELLSLYEILKGSVDQKKKVIVQHLKEVTIKKAKLENSFNDMPAKEREYKKAQLYYSLYEEHYLALMQVRTDFEIAKAGTKNDIIILSSANLPTHPISPDKLMIYGVGFVAGFVLSLFFVAIRYLLSNTITSVNELERLTEGTTILGVLPLYSSGKLKETRLIISKTSRTSISESLRSMRTNLEFLGGVKSNKIISITSTVSAEGKTFVSVNLGGILSLSNRKVIVVDMDMRKPRIHKAFESHRNEIGVSTVLIGKSSLDESICKSEIETLDYLPAGPTPPNPSELLLNGEFDKMINELVKHYDHIILDTPPSGIVTDAILVMKKADIPIYVFRANYSKKKFVKTLNRLKYINKFSNIAIVLNGLKNAEDNKYGYGYYVEEYK